MPERSKDKRFLIVIQLSDKYGGISNIPQEELDAIDYVRTTDNRLVPRERYHLLQERKDPWQQKIENAPFSTLEMQFPKTDSNYLRLTNKEIINVYHKLEDLNFDTFSQGFIDFIEDYALQPTQPFFVFYDRFEAFLTSLDEKLIVEDELLEEIVHYLVSYKLFIKPLLNNSHLQHLFKNTYELFHLYEFNDELTSEKAQELDDTLERAKGQLADIPLLQSIFIEALHTPIMPYLLTDEKDFTTTTAFIEANNINTVLDLFLAFVYLFLEQENMLQLSNDLLSLRDLTEIESTITTYLREANHDLVIEERKIKNTINATKSPDERLTLQRNFSSRLKEIAEEKKQRTQILLGLRDFFRLPTLAADFYQRKIKDIQQLLVASSGNTLITISLDGRPHPEYDADPGSMSGDCTEGKPLPFADAFISCYNIKVFAESQHRGNIYLLKTVDSHKRPIWHLDAIQIPHRLVAWSEAIPVLMEKLGNEARKQNVYAITVNSEKELISNYDYISNAILQYEKTIDLPALLIKQPRITETEIYSRFQTNGIVYIVWENN